MKNFCKVTLFSLFCLSTVCTAVSWSADYGGISKESLRLGKEYNVLKRRANQLLDLETQEFHAGLVFELYAISEKRDELEKNSTIAVPTEIYTESRKSIKDKRAQKRAEGLNRQ